jgi:hypothetical protein
LGGNVVEASISDYLLTFLGRFGREVEQQRGGISREGSQTPAPLEHLEASVRRGLEPVSAAQKLLHRRFEQRIGGL